MDEMSENEISSRLQQLGVMKNRGGEGRNEPRTESLILRVDQPIENVEFTAHSLLKGVDGSLISQSARKIEYVWYRGAFQLTCSFPKCKKKAQKGALQSLFNGTFYCSSRCFKLAFRAFPSKMIDRSMTGLTINNENMDRYEDVKDIAHQSLPFVEDKAWAVICKEKNYTPTAEDVGFVLKVECFAYTDDGRLSVKQEAITNVSSKHGILLEFICLLTQFFGFLCVETGGSRRSH